MCSFCSASSILTCAWPVPAFVPARYGDILLGDVIRRVGDQRDPARVVSLGALGENTVWFDLRKPNGKTKWICQFKNELVDVQLGTRPCGARACNAHVREVGEGIGYARCHWDSWSQIA